MKEGILYSICDGVMKAGRRLSPVETLKDIVGFIVRSLTDDQEAEIVAKRRAIEIYLIVKWMILGAIWLSGWQHWVGIVLMAYLMIFNLHSYIDHHLWNLMGDLNAIRLKRRFVSLIQGVMFNTLGFAYFYQIHLAEQFEIGRFSLRAPLVSVCFSVLNTFGSGGDVARPISQTSLLVMTLQVITTFIFVGLLLSRAITEREDQNGV